MNLFVMIQKSIHDTALDKKRLRESLGYLLSGFGMMLGLACYSYSPLDYEITGAVILQPDNLAGRFGASLAGIVLHSFGVIGLLWPVTLVFLGGCLALGFIRSVSAKRFVALGILSVFGASFIHVLFIYAGDAAPSFGFGGSIGEMIGTSLFAQTGYGGALIVSAMLLLMSLSVSGNLALSETASLVQSIRYYTLRTSRKLWAFALDLKRREEYRLLHRANPGQYILNDSHLPPGANGNSSGPRSSPAKSQGIRRSSKRKELQELSPHDGLPYDEIPGEDSDSSVALELFYTGKVHAKPTPSIFKKSEKAPKHADGYHDKIALKLTKQLREFKVEGDVKKITEGPIVTTFEFEPSPGTKVSKITGLSDDLARLLEAQSLRILAPIPGKKVLGFEVPNKESRMIGFSDLLEHRDFRSTKINLPVAMGLDTFGKPKIVDLAAMPHLLVAGSTGSGKSVFMNSLIASLAIRHSAKDLRFIMIDPKMVEMAAYNDLPHLACPVVTDPRNEAKAVLDALVNEMEDRYQKMRMLGTRNVAGFNEIIKKKRKTDFPSYDGKWATLPYIVLIIDELADMMMVLGKDAEGPITRIAQKARAAGIHMVIATQRPSAEVVTGLIKANFPTRVAFRVLSGIDSRTILDTSGAEGLLGRGDMLYLSSTGLERLHGAFISDEEVQKMVATFKKSK